MYRDLKRKLIVPGEVSPKPPSKRQEHDLGLCRCGRDLVKKLKEK